MRNMIKEFQDDLREENKLKMELLDKSDECGEKTQTAEWIDVNDALPDKAGDLVVLIDGHRFLATAGPWGMYVFYDNEHVIHYQTPCKEITGEMREGRWGLPKAFREPEYWMYTPKIPEVETK